MESMKLLKNLGFYRMIMKVSPDGLVAPEVDGNTREQIRIISCSIKERRSTEEESTAV
ncbi:hypothetical protein [Clostridium sp.]|uniref:hypothetical protein n=1 Tax=Clostridium sp. TaxID=1506 RepID=UPI00321650AC